MLNIHNKIIQLKPNKMELMFHFMDKENIVTYNESIIIIEKHNFVLPSKESLLIFPQKNKKLEKFRTRTEVIEFQNYYAINESLIGKYPEYRFILPVDLEVREYAVVDNMMDLVYFGCLINEVTIDILKNYNFFKELSILKPTGKAWVRKLKGPNNILFVGDDRVILVLIPKKIFDYKKELK
jgi:hypothetical protein